MFFAVTEVFCELAVGTHILRCMGSNPQLALTMCISAAFLTRAFCLFPSEGRKCLQDPHGGGVCPGDKLVLEGKLCLSASYMLQCAKLAATC